MRSLSFLCIVFCCFLSFQSMAQVDSIKSEDSYRFDTLMLKKGQMTPDYFGKRPWYRRNPYKAYIAPTVLIGLGVAMINNPIYDRHDFHYDLHHLFKSFPASTQIDNILVFTPYIGLVALNLSKIKCQNDFINTSLIIVKSGILTLVLTDVIKYTTKIERPNGQDDLSFPSGHTSAAFMAATVVNREYRYKSPWIGVAAYGLASTVGLFRMLHDKHWVSDVLAGAGIGILSVNTVYLTHKWRWGRPGSCFAPTMIYGKPGFVFACKF